MKKLFTLLSLLVVAVSMFGQEFTIGDLTYAVLSEEEKTVQVVNGQNATGAVVVPKTVTYENVDYNVTTIRGDAFNGNSNITSLSLPSIRHIDNSAFFGCSSLTSVSVPSVTNIEGYAFYGCNNIQSLRIGSIEQWCKINFGEAAHPAHYASSIVDLFIGSSNVPVKNLEIPNTITEIHDYAFVNLSITKLSAQTVTSIGSHSFVGCGLIEEAIIPKAENIGNDAFRGSYSYEDYQYHSVLRYIDLSSVKSIANDAFEGCNNINSIRIGSVDQWCQINFEGENTNPLRETAQKVELYVGDSETPAKNLVASNALTEIPSWAFKNTNIESISAPSVATIGAGTFWGCFSLASVNLSAATSIGSHAFYNCTSLKAISLPAAKTIGEWAFSKCLSLPSITLPVAISIGDESFVGCETLKEIIMPKVETIGFEAFGSMSRSGGIEDDKNYDYHCDSLMYVDMSSVTSIGNDAFNGCTSISSLRIGSVDQWCQVSIGNGANPLAYSSQPVDLYVGDSETPTRNITTTAKVIPAARFINTTITSVNAPAATEIGESAFSRCKNLESAIIPKAETIGAYAFGEMWYYPQYFCTSLKYVDLSSVKSIGENAFTGCSNISSLRIGSVDQWCQVNFENGSNLLINASNPIDVFIADSKIPATDIRTSVTTIPESAFRMTTIKGVSAPSVVTLGGSAFSGCTNLKSVEIPLTIVVGDGVFADCESLDHIDIPNATTIGVSAFAGCTALKSISLPKAISVGSEAFAGCESLEEAIMPKVETLGNRVFWCVDEWKEDGTIRHCCTSLKHVDLSSAKSIEDRVFEYCFSLTSVLLPSATYIGDEAFYSCSKLSHLELPEVKHIEERALGGMSALKYLSIPKVEKIGLSAFSGTHNIDTLRVGSIEQYCNIKYQVYEGVAQWEYHSTFPFYPNGDNNDKNFLFIGDSETPATEITIPESVEQVPDFAFLGTGIHTIHFTGATPPSLVSTNSFSEWTMLAVPEEAYETYLAADVYNTIPLQITKDGHITQELEVEAKSNTSALLAKVGDKEIRNVINLKLKGTINSYDMLIIRNRMTSLRNLDLSEASIVDCDYAYSTFEGNSYHSVKDEITADWLHGIMNLKLPADTKTIGDNALGGCASLVSIDIPNGVTSIGSRAFANCYRIIDLTLPQSVVTFGIEAFDGCTGLKEVVIPDGVNSICSHAFYGCRDLKEVTIPASVTEIGAGAFANLGEQHYVEVNGQGMWVHDPISLRISSVDTWKDVNISGNSWYGGAFDNVGTLFIGESEEPVDTLVIPEGTTELKDFTFAGFKCLKSVALPQELTCIGNQTFWNAGITEISLPDSLNSIGSYAFSGTALTEVKLPEKIKDINNYTFAGCGNLEKIEFNDSLTTIGSYAFQDCYNLKKVLLPSYLERIYSRAFEGCSNLTEVLVPASIKEIGDYTFIGCNNLNNVIATTVEPIAINQNTFSTYRTSNVYSPRTSYWKYYWNTQWNQFLSVNEYGKKHHYKYFYLRGQNGEKKEDLELDDETGVLAGAEDEVTGAEKAPDADLYVGAGLIVDGEQTQHLKHIHFHHDGKHGASMIGKGKGKVLIDSLSVDINVENGKWYFFCFPFDIKPGDAHYNGSHVWYLYDGVTRANKGNGGWKKVAADATMEAGHGYIFQGAVDGTLTLSAKDVVIDSRDIATELKTHHSPNKNDASWNLIGNLNFAYYDIDNLEYQAPVTIYDNETGNYEAVRPGDDDYHFHPFQAFFVQKPDGKDHMNFHGSVKETKNKSDEKKARKAAARAKAPMQVDAMRKIINLELASAEPTVGSVAVPTDRTRIVLNPTKSIDYETDCDAAKFIADNMPQIYSLGPSSDDGQPAIDYAINERPVGNGIIDIAVKTVKEGVYTISAPRINCAAKLRDLETGSVVDLTKGGYTFAAEATAYTNRFQLILGDEETAIHEVGEDMATINVETGAINVREAGAEVKVYTTGGSLVASQNGTGSIHVPAGIYVVTVNGKSTKVTVKD